MKRRCEPSKRWPWSRPRPSPTCPGEMSEVELHACLADALPGSAIWDDCSRSLANRAHQRQDRLIDNLFCASLAVIGIFLIAALVAPRLLA